LGQAGGANAANSDHVAQSLYQRIISPFRDKKSALHASGASHHPGDLKATQRFSYGVAIHVEHFRKLGVTRQAVTRGEFAVAYLGADLFANRFESATPSHLQD